MAARCDAGDVGRLRLSTASAEESNAVVGSLELSPVAAMSVCALRRGDRRGSRSDSILRSAAAGENAFAIDSDGDPVNGICNREERGDTVE